MFLQFRFRLFIYIWLLNLQELTLLLQLVKWSLADCCVSWSHDGSGDAWTWWISTVDPCHCPLGLLLLLRLDHLSQVNVAPFALLGLEGTPCLSDRIAGPRRVCYSVWSQIAWNLFVLQPRRLCNITRPSLIRRLLLASVAPTDGSGTGRHLLDLLQRQSGHLWVLVAFIPFHDLVFFKQRTRLRLRKHSKRIRFHLLDLPCLDQRTLRLPQLTARFQPIASFAASTSGWH